MREIVSVFDTAVSAKVEVCEKLYLYLTRLCKDWKLIEIVSVSASVIDTAVSAKLEVRKKLALVWVAEYLSPVWSVLNFDLFCVVPEIWLSKHFKAFHA